MAEVYHIKIKKEYAAALIDDLIKMEAVENIESHPNEIAQWQKDALDKELNVIEDNSNYTIPWDDVKNRFNEP